MGHQVPPARNPRPKGSQKGTVKRGHQHGPFNWNAGPAAGGCLLALLMLPVTALRRK